MIEGRLQPGADHPARRKQQALTGVLAGVCMLLAPVLLPQAARAGITFTATNRLELAEGETLAGEQWVIADEAQLDGRVPADFFLLTRSLSAAGRFGRDLWVVGERMEIKADIAGSLRLAAGRNARVAAEVGSNVLAAAQVLDLAPESRVGGAALLVGDTLLARGSIAGSAQLIGRKVTLGGTIGGDVKIMAEDIVLLPGTVVRGDLQYTAPAKLVPGQRVTIEGQLKRTLPPRPDRWSTLGALALQQLTYLFGAAAAGWLWLRLFPFFTAAAVERLRKGPWRAMGAGLVLLLAGVPLFLIFIWLPVLFGPMLLLGAGGTLLVYAAKIPVALLLGSLILQRRAPSAGIMAHLLSGLVLLYFLGSFPLFTFSVWLVVCCAGAGAMLLEVLGGRQPPSRESRAAQSGNGENGAEPDTPGKGQSTW